MVYAVFAVKLNFKTPKIVCKEVKMSQICLNLICQFSNKRWDTAIIFQWWTSRAVCLGKNTTDQCEPDLEIEVYL